MLALLISTTGVAVSHSDAASTCASNWGGGSSTCVTAVAVCLAESSGNCNAKYVNTGGSIDRGLWQINDKWHPEVSDVRCRRPPSAPAPRSTSPHGMLTRCAHTAC